MKTILAFLAFLTFVPVPASAQSTSSFTCKLLIRIDGFAIKKGTPESLSSTLRLAGPRTTTRHSFMEHTRSVGDKTTGQEAEFHPGVLPDHTVA